MPHHGHFVERRLTVEDDQVAVSDVPFNLKAVTSVQISHYTRVSELLLHFMQNSWELR
jgi:hypothetical protein